MAEFLERLAALMNDDVYGLSWMHLKITGILWGVACIVDKLSHWKIQRCLQSHFPLLVSETRKHKRVLIHLRVYISLNISQKQHITQISLHPKEGSLRLKMLLAELRRIFPTMSLTLCWQKNILACWNTAERWCCCELKWSLKLTGQIN